MANLTFTISSWGGNYLRASTELVEGNFTDLRVGVHWLVCGWRMGGVGWDGNHGCATTALVEGNFADLRVGGGWGGAGQLLAGWLAGAVYVCKWAGRRAVPSSTFTPGPLLLRAPGSTRAQACPFYQS